MCTRAHTHALICSFSVPTCLPPPDPLCLVLYLCFYLCLSHFLLGLSLAIMLVCTCVLKPLSLSLSRIRSHARTRPHLPPSPPPNTHTHTHTHTCPCTHTIHVRTLLKLRFHSGQASLHNSQIGLEHLDSVGLLLYQSFQRLRVV